MARPRLLNMALALLLALGSAGCWGNGPAGKGGPKTFQVATLTWVGYGPLYLAQEKGFFQGIDVKLHKIEDTAARRAALSTGDVQGSVDIVDSFANAFAAGIPAQVVLKLDDSLGGDGLVVKKEIRTVQDLKGKTIAYPPGQPSHFFLLALLHGAGLSIKDVESRPMEPDQAGAAFVSGNVDAAVTWEPWLTKASQLPHARILTTSRDTPGLIADVFTVRQDFLERNPETVAAFIRGWLAAVDYWRASRGIEPDHGEGPGPGREGVRADDRGHPLLGPRREPAVLHARRGPSKPVHTADGQGQRDLDPRGGDQDSEGPQPRRRLANRAGPAAMTRLYTTVCTAVTFLLFLGAWGLAAHWLRPADETGLVLLPGPLVVARDLLGLFRDQQFLRDVLQSVLRITLGLLASTIPAFLLGILMGGKPRLYAMAEPLFSFASYVPPTALIPILILWLGIGLPQQMALLFLGTFFHLAVNVADTVARTPQAYYDTALTLGAGRRQLIWKVTIPHALPEFFQHLRTIVAVAWTYLVVIEMVSSESGIGRVIINSQRFLLTGRLFAGVFTIGLLGILSNKLFLFADRLLCKWKYTEEESLGTMLRDWLSLRADSIRPTA